MEHLFSENDDKNHENLKTDFSHDVFNLDNKNDFDENTDMMIFSANDEQNQEK